MGRAQGVIEGNEFRVVKVREQGRGEERDGREERREQ